MARANNKYTSINYNHILQKNSSPSSSSSSSAPSYSSVARSNGRMLVLKRSSPKPLTSPATKTTTTTTTTTTPVSPAPTIPNQTLSDPDPDPNQISLRPLGHTGPGSSLSFPARTQGSEKESVSTPIPTALSAKPDRFVPPHLRPGFIPKDERSSPQQPPRQVHGQTGRPKSGGYERTRPDPRSIGNRPGTSGWYVNPF